MNKKILKKLLLTTTIFTTSIIAIPIIVTSCSIVNKKISLKIKQNELQKFLINYAGDTNNTSLGVALGNLNANKDNIIEGIKNNKDTFFNNITNEIMENLEIEFLSYNSKIKVNFLNISSDNIFFYLENYKLATNETLLNGNELKDLLYKKAGKKQSTLINDAINNLNFKKEEIINLLKKDLNTYFINPLDTSRNLDLIFEIVNKNISVTILNVSEQELMLTLEGFNLESVTIKNNSLNLLNDKIHEKIENLRKYNELEKIFKSNDFLILVNSESILNGIVESIEISNDTEGYEFTDKVYNLKRIYQEFKFKFVIKSYIDLKIEDNNNFVLERSMTNKTVLSTKNIKTQIAKHIIFNGNKKENRILPVIEKKVKDWAKITSANAIFSKYKEIQDILQKELKGGVGDMIERVWILNEPNITHVKFYIKFTGDLMIDNNGSIESFNSGYNDTYFGDNGEFGVESSQKSIKIPRGEGRPDEVENGKYILHYWNIEAIPAIQPKI